MFVPLIIFRILIDVVGVEKFGLLNLVIAFVVYFQILIDYGFNNSATRQISLNKGREVRLNIIINKVISAKIYLLIFSFIIFSLIVFSLPSFKENWGIYFLYFGVTIGYTFSPSWYYQGIQNMKSYMFTNIIVKISSLVIIILIIKEENDFWLVPLVLSLSQIIIAIVTFSLLFLNTSYRFKLLSPNKIYKELNEGKYFFLSELQATLFTNTNILILGFFSSLTNVAYFTSADKLSRCIRNIQIPLSNALYPHLSIEINKDPIKGLKQINKITLVGLSILISSSIIIGYFGEKIIILIFSKDMIEATRVFQILLLIPIFSFVDSMYGKQILLNLKKDKIFFNIFLFSSIFCLLLSCILSYKYNIIGTAIAVVIGQGILAILMFFYAQKIVYGKS
ncbi:polysaccharide transporter, PST family [Algoriella xinjiangensis]|uniref:Polysaccharide transporter, PST family n=2 Tax=Algoriella xinjiangensis TaxID=684065 RepID=A0A1I4YKB8_9FLAO|nr:polysaccharide transporter, PST family [Algoriella xinjiangensis]